MAKNNPMIIYLINFDVNLLEKFLNNDNTKWQKKQTSSNEYEEFEWIYEIDKNDTKKESYPWKAYKYENKDKLKKAIKDNKNNNQILLIFENNNVDEFLNKNNYVEIGIITEANYSQNKDELNIYLTKIKYDKENMRKSINNIYIFKRKKLLF